MDLPEPIRIIPQLELALLRRGVGELVQARETCCRCHRSPLIGERVYELPSGRAVCELCRSVERTPPTEFHVIHGPAFGHTLRVIDRRAAA